MSDNNRFHILALDGGGTRGIYSAQLLAYVEQTFDVCIKECFDLIVGTSTGSIIAGAVVSDIPMVEIVELFEIEAPDIFRKRWYRNPLFFSKYSNEKLAQIIAKHIPAIPLSKISTPLMITSSEITTSELHIFRSNYVEKQNEFDNLTGDVCLRDAIVASCAAPTFFAPKDIQSHLLADGGLWANNPSIAAYTEALTYFGKEATEVKIVSLGTGHSVSMYRKKRGWGFLSGWGGIKIVSYVMTLQSQASANMAKLLLKENYLRIDPPIDFWDIDTVVQSENLKTLAERDFTEHASKIEAFIKPSVQNPML
ncbi:patatin-like phospholipase family protein [Candidatus Poribacteria bacterium]|nr:patatin-like phospholipase family protein [Candidatus Poribacteria bacterium]